MLKYIDVIYIYNKNMFLVSLNFVDKQDYKLIANRNITNFLWEFTYKGNPENDTTPYNGAEL